jgi:Protein of unknown function DUF262
MTGEIATGAADEAVLKPMLVGDVAGAFVVRDYQRGYRWGKEEVTRLLDDIADSEGKYYLQPVVVKKLDDTWELVDGQQRLTTLYFILSYIRTHLPRTQVKYSLSYDTRKQSAEYLEHPTEDRSQSNIDFFFMFQASERIREWFEAKSDPDLAAVNFYKALAERVYVIWYEAPHSLDSRTLFTRLNVGRIPLTNAELVKAVLLSKIERREEVAAQWDSFERDLWVPEVWAFATRNSRQEATHISLLLDMLAVLMKGPAKHPFHTFEALRESMLAESPKAVWDRVVTLHSLVMGWYDDHDLFHKIGYLVSTGSLLGDFIRPALEMTRPDFNALLDQRIRQRLGLTRSALTDLDYEHDREKCKQILELMNVETVRSRGDQSHRYSFADHASQEWSLEHIHAQSAEQLDEVRQWTKWLELHKAALLDLPDVDADVRDALVERIDAALPTINSDKFHMLEHEIIPLFTPAAADTDGVHAISNLALLAGADNSVLNNSCFEVKRRDVLQFDRDGSYIPPATRNVFLKYYTEAKSQQIHFWGPQDRAGYLAALEDAIGPFLQPEDGDE